MDSSADSHHLVRLNAEGFAQDLKELKADIYSRLNEDDYRHLQKVQWFGRGLTLLGFATAWLFPNPLSIFCISMGIFTRWLVMHHIGHGGYDKVPGVPKHMKRQHFAQGWRRYFQWFDWIHTNGWNYEHNILHHYHTGEHKDPDLVERHVEWLRTARLPRWLKTTFIYLAGLTWKFTYYAPNTMSVLDPATLKRQKFEHIAWITILNVLDLRQRGVRQLWLHCYLPYIGFHFVLLPLLFLPLGRFAVISVLINRILAELLTNFHAFLVIAPSHSGHDVCRYSFHFKGQEQFYLMQVLGTANYPTGKEWIDYLHIYLNYQIEHHLFPDLPMRRYREIQPRVKAICEANGVPYLQENVFVRLHKLVRVCNGSDSMISLDHQDDMALARHRMLEPAEVETEQGCHDLAKARAPNKS